MMTSGSVWILFICFHIQRVISGSPEELLLAMKETFAQQPDCTPMFEIRHPGYISANAKAHPSITTYDECRSSCIMDETCMSYQIDTRKGETFCRLQSSYSIEDLQGPISADVKEYVFTVKCENSTVEEKCHPLIEVRLRNWNSYLAREQLSVKSEMECRALCFDDQNCMSYHIDKISGHPLCFIQKNLGTFTKSQLYMGKEVAEYFVVDRCLDKYEVSYSEGCSSVFKKLHKEASKMATPYPFLTTEQLCRLTCLFAPDCVSYQINRNQRAPFCSIQTNGDNLKEDERMKVDLVTEYILVDSCTDKPLEKTDPDCKPFIIPKPYPGVSFGAEPHAEVTSYEDCQLLCIATPTCVAFQNTSLSVYCWIQKDWKQLMPDQSYVNGFATEYIVVRKCSKGLSNQMTTPRVTGNVPGTTKSSPPTTDKCSNHDVVFAICTTGILPGNLESEKRLKALISFVSDVVAGLKVASKMDQIAVVTFERNAYVEFYLNSYSDPTPLAEAIAKIGCHKCVNGETSASSALTAIKTEILTKSKGYRPEVSQMIVMITDRAFTIDLGKTDALVSDLTKSGAYIIPVGVTDAVDEDDLQSFATPTKKGKSQQLLWAENFASLNTLVLKVNNTIATIAC